MLIRAKVTPGTCLATCLLALVWVVGISNTIADEPPIAKKSGKIRDTILTLDDQFWEAASRHDVETLNRLFGDDYFGIGNDGTRWTKSTLLEQHRTAHLGDLKRTSEREVIRLGDHAVLLTYDAKFKVFTKDGVLRDTAYQRLLSCRVLRDGGWFVVFSQATDLVDPTVQSQPNASQVDRQTTKSEGAKEGNEGGKSDVGKTTVVSLRDVIVDEVDAGQNTITVTIGHNETIGGKSEGTNDRGGKVVTGERKISTRLVNLPVSKDAQIRISFKHEPGIVNHFPRNISELKPGMSASLELTVGEDEIVKPLVVSKIVGWREP